MTDDFFGKPIHGDITHYTEAEAEQHDSIELVNLLDALLKLDHVESVKWRQYTPYFNDGDPCVFGVYGPEVLLDIMEEDDEEGDYGDNYLGTYELWKYGEGSDWETRSANKVYTYRGIDTKAIYDAMHNLDRAIPHHVVVLKKKFGDPAEVVFNENGFNVEFYNHD